MFKSYFLFIIISVFSLSSLSFSEALEPDFFKRQKKIEREKKRRQKGATSYTKKRNRELKKKDKAAVKYRKIRKKAEKKQIKQDAIFEKEMLKPEDVNSYKIKKAQKYAEKKRKQAGDPSWKTQNLEFGIQVQEPNLINKKSKDQ